MLETAPLNSIESTNSVSHDTKSGIQDCANPRGWLRCHCDHGAIFWKVVRCRRCDGCAMNQQAKRTAQIITGLEGQVWKSLLTLTSVPGTSWSAIMSAFTSLIRTLRKLYGDVQYAVVKEEGASTLMRHLHIVLVGPSWVPHAVVSRLWYARLGAFVVNIKRVSGTRVASYVAKYVTKCTLGLRKGLTFSRGWIRSKKPAYKYDPFYHGLNDTFWDKDGNLKPWTARSGKSIMVACWGWDGQWCECPGLTNPTPT